MNEKDRFLVIGMVVLLMGLQVLAQGQKTAGLKNLLEIVDTNKHVEKGTWFKREDGLFCKGGRAVKIRFPYTPPQQFDCEIVFTISDKKVCPILLFPIDGKLASRGINSYGKLVNTNTMKVGEKTKWLVQVRKDKVVCIVNGVEAGNWNSKEVLVKPGNENEISNPKQMGLSVHGKSIVFHNILVKKSGKGSGVIVPDTRKGRPSTKKPEQASEVAKKPLELPPEIEAYFKETKQLKRKRIKELNARLEKDPGSSYARTWEKKIRQLRKKDYIAHPILELAVGKIGKLRFSQEHKVVTVINPNEMLVDLLVADTRGAMLMPIGGRMRTRSFGSKERKIVWFKNISTKGMVDGAQLTLDGVYRVTGTRRTRFGQTAFVLEPFPVKMYLEIAQKIKSEKIKKARQEAPSKEPSSKLSLGKAYLESGMVKKAKLIFQEIISKYPDTKAAEEAKEELRKIKQEEKAVQKKEEPQK